MGIIWGHLGNNGWILWEWKNRILREKTGIIGTSLFWKSIKHLSKKESSIGTVLHEGQVCQSDQEKANGINTFFSQCFNQSVSPISPIVPAIGREVPSSLLCTESEIYELLRGLDVSKSSGRDGISARMLKNTAEAIATSITNLFNCSTRCGTPPNAWKTSSIVPIPKTPRAQHSSDFRPISLFSNYYQSFGVSFL